MVQSLEYLFRRPSMVDMESARQRFLDDDVVTLGSFPPVEIEDGQLWQRRRARSLGRQLHGWFFYYYLRPFQVVDDTAVLSKLMHMLQAWRETVELPPTRIPMAYHDETTAQRLIALTCLREDYGHLMDEPEIALLDQVFTESIELLSSDDFHSANTNHGMYQDLALLVGSKYAPDAETVVALANQRLQDYFLNAYTRDGIHREHSPEYHLIVTAHLKEYVSYLEHSENEIVPELTEIWHNAQNYLPLAITPLGTFPPVSDTTSATILSTSYVNQFREPRAQFAMTQGALGTVPTESVAYYPDTGIAIFRENWTDLDSLYLYFSASYNSKYHKHSDDLSLYLVHRGIEILREAGPNGYEMQDPFTKYAFSSFAHNTLIVDGAGVAREDDSAMSDVGLRQLPGDDLFAVEGFNARFPGVMHRRQVRVPDQHEALRPVVLISDTIDASSTHEYTLLWHLGPGVSASIDSDVVELRESAGVMIARMKFESTGDIDVKVVSGQTEPYILGWHFPVMGQARENQTLMVKFTGSARQLETSIELL